jgi:hypothetical protein
MKSASRQEIVKGPILTSHVIRRIGEHVVEQDAHAERASPARNSVANAPEAHDPQRLATSIEAERRQWLSRGPMSVAHVVEVLDEATRDVEDKRDRQVRDRVAEHARRIAHGDAARRGGSDVDVVVSDAEVRDHSKLGRSAKQGLVYRKLCAAEQPFGLGERCKDLRSIATRIDGADVALVRDAPQCLGVERQRNTGNRLRRRASIGSSLDPSGLGHCDILRQSWAWADPRARVAVADTDERTLWGHGVR